MDVNIKHFTIINNNLTFTQFCYLFSLDNRLKDNEFNELLNKRLIFIDDDKKVQLSGTAHNLLMKIQNEFRTNRTSPEILKDFSKTLMNIFPKGKKPGTNLYWRGNTTEVTKKITRFFQMNPEFSDTAVIQATTKYVASFKEDFQFMRILPYFIEKNGISELLTILQNMDDDEDTPVESDTILV